MDYLLFYDYSPDYMVRCGKFCQADLVLFRPLRKRDNSFWSTAMRP